MSFDSLVFWLFIAAWAIVVGALLFVLLRLVSELRRIVTRVSAIVGVPPLGLEFAKAESDMKRLNGAIDRLPRLQQRALVAIQVMRDTPLIPPAIVEARARIAHEFRAFANATNSTNAKP